MTSKTTYFVDITKAVDIITTTDVGRLTNENAVIESIINIMLTQPGERVWQPRFGCNLSQFQFEPVDFITAHWIETAVVDSIREFEPRVDSLTVTITPEYDLNTFIIDIEFSITTSTDTHRLQTTLKKLR